MPEFNHRNKLRFNKMDTEMNSLRRHRPLGDSPRSMAVERHVQANLNRNGAVGSALLPIAPDGPQRMRMKRGPMSDPARIKCSLDILIAIVNEQVRYETEHACTSSDGTNDTDDNDNNETDNKEEDEEDEEDEAEAEEEDEEDSEYEEEEEGNGDEDDEHEFGDRRKYSTQASVEPCEEHYTSPEQDAAMGLLMASFVQHYQAPRKRRQINADAYAFEGGSLRSRRLSQNQLYRKRLQDKGVYPIRQGPRQYACSLCCEVFVKEMFVWRHGAKHLESKPFQCALCGGTFNRSDSLQRHVRNFHRKK